MKNKGMIYFYSRITCGSCRKDNGIKLYIMKDKKHVTNLSELRKDYKKQGWRFNAFWGWLCPSCLAKGIGKTIERNK